MPENDHHDLELSEVFGFFLSSQATNRARFTVILKILARILAQLEDRDQEEVLAELRQMLADEKESIRRGSIGIQPRYPASSRA